MNQLNILHIGDLHAPPKLTKRDQEETVKWATGTISRIAREDGIQLIVCTGDLGSEGKLQRKGFELLEQLRSAAQGKNGAAPPVIVTPGNHDVTWPNTSKKLSAWTIDNRYPHFCKSFNDASSRAGGVWIRPDLTRKERHRSSNTPYWHSWDASDAACTGIDSPHVFVLALASPDQGGSPLENPAVDDVIGTVLIPIEKKLRKDPLCQELLKTVRVDVPYVDPGQLDALHQAIDKARAHEAFHNAIRILVLHHPLLPFPGEQEYRPHDTVANGWEVLTRLQESSGHPFHLVLYGHRHKPGYHLLHGVYRQRSGHLPPVELQETAFVSCGHLLGAKAEAPSAFHLIRLESQLRRSQDRTLVRLDTYVKPQTTRPDTQSLLTVGPCGQGRWIEVGDKRLFRKTDLIREFSKFVENIERAPPEVLIDQRSSMKQFHDVDVFIKARLDEAWSFLEGTRGVTDEFVELSCAAANSSSAMYFVDAGGYGTWFQPPLLELLVGLFAKFLAVNKESLNGRWMDGKWVHRSFIQERRERLLKSSGGKLPSVDGATPLPFDMARILIWPFDKLDELPGIALKRMHRPFDVPLFWCDRSVLDKFPPSPKTRDFVLEWETAAPGDNLPTRVVYDPREGLLDPNDVRRGDRRVNTQERQLEYYLGLYKFLLSESTPLYV